MPSASQLYNTGRWLNASDLLPLNQRRTAVVHHCQPEEIGQGNDQKTMLMLDLVSRQGQPWPKKLPLNKSNTMQMVSAFGDDYGQWPGKAIEVWAENVMFSGKMVPGLKVQAAPNGAVPAQAVPAVPAAAPASYPPMPPQAPLPSPPPSATAVAGIPPGGRPVSSIPDLSKPIEDDDIPF